MVSNKAEDQPILSKIAETRIFLIRNHRVMLNSDLAGLYQVSSKVLTQAVKRNLGRFPNDFMFQLNPSEWESLRSQFVTSKIGRGGTRYAPYAFTEQGIAMLSSVLNSESAIKVNIEIVRAFVRLREMAATNKDLAKKLIDLERKYDGQFKTVFEAIRQIMQPTIEPTRRKIGIRQD
jgi:hypothetical protein